VTVDLRGAVLSILDVSATYIAPELAKSRDLPVGDHTVAIGDMLATSTSNGRSVAIGRPSLITSRCYKEYM
jgi:hypothetical protein